MNRGRREEHRIGRTGWLRAAVLGANDGIISTASLVLGVAVAHVEHGNIMITAVAGLVAGAMSMATGEYVSVSSQSDTEQAAVAEEKSELAEDFESEHRELAAIYMARGLDRPLALEVARQLMQHDALGAHTRDELGISELTTARPLQAALASAVSFAVGAALPLTVAAIASERYLVVMMALVSLVALAFLGGLAAHAGGAKIGTGVGRVTFWSALAMGLSCAVGAMFGGAA